MQMHLALRGSHDAIRELLYVAAPAKPDSNIEISWTVYTLPRSSTSSATVTIVGPLHEVLNESLSWATSAAKTDIEIELREADDGNPFTDDDASLKAGIMKADIGSYLGLTGRPYNLLARVSIRTIEDLCAKTLDDLFDIRGLGTKSIKQIEDALKAKGLSLRPSRPYGI